MPRSVPRCLQAERRSVFGDAIHVLVSREGDVEAERFGTCAAELVSRRFQT
jgi:hypothetical protein